MVAQFTDRARKIMVLAYRQAQRLHHDRMDMNSGHLLLGLIDEGSGVAAHVLKDLGVNFANARREVENLLFAAGPSMVAVERLSYPPAVKKVLRYSLEEARGLNHDFVGSEHLLLGMLRDRSSVAAQALSKVGVESTTVRTTIVQLLGTPRIVERCLRPLPSLISVGPLGRGLFGLCSFLSSLVFTAVAVALAIWLATIGPPVILWKVILVHLALDIFAVASIFMLLLTISFWTSGSRWTDRLLYLIMPKGSVAVGTVLTALFVTVGIISISDPGLRVLGVLGFFLAFLTFIFLVAVPFISLIRRRNHSLPKQNE